MRRTKVDRSSLSTPRDGPPHRCSRGLGLELARHSGPSVVTLASHFLHRAQLQAPTHAEACTIARHIHHCAIVHHARSTRLGADRTRASHAPLADRATSHSEHANRCFPHTHPKRAGPSRVRRARGGGLRRWCGVQIMLDTVRSVAAESPLVQQRLMTVSHPRPLNMQMPSSSARMRAPQGPRRECD